METTVEQREYASELNQERMGSKPQHRTASSNPSTTELDLIIFLPIAIIADLIGGLDLTGFGAIIVRIINLPILGILWLWRVMKQGPGKKNDYTYQLLLTFLVETSPFGIIPTWATFVIYAYLKDQKFGREILAKKTKEIIRNKNQ